MTIWLAEHRSPQPFVTDYPGGHTSTAVETSRGQTGRMVSTEPYVEVGGDADIAAVATLFADRTRASILGALADGRALAASVLADEAGVSAPAASAQLARLTKAGLIGVEVSGPAPLLPPGLGPGGDRASRRWPRLRRRCRSGRCARAPGRPRCAGRGPATTTWPGATASRSPRGCSTAVPWSPATGSPTPGAAAATRSPPSSHEHPYELGAGRRPGAAASSGVDLDAVRRGGRPAPAAAVLPRLERAAPPPGRPAGRRAARRFLDQGWVDRRTGHRALTVTDAGEAALGSTA